jgi:acyl-CoA synthetase (AMP-forming)/AMP-acid ligase II
VGVSAPLRPAATLPSLLSLSAERFGNAPFVVVDGETLSYEGVEHASRRLADELIDLGVVKGSHVGLLMPNSAIWVIAWFALTRLGAVAVPVNTFSKPRELAWTLQHADVSFLLTRDSFRSNDYLARLEEALPGLSEQHSAGSLRITAAPQLRRIIVWGDEDRAWSSKASELDDLTVPADETSAFSFVAYAEASVVPADDAVIIYTSGSTGEPKGPVHSHGAVVRHSLALSRIYDVRPDDVVFTAMPFFWVGGLITGLHAVLHHGATLLTQSAFEPDEALDLMERHRVTMTMGWPQQGKTLAAHQQRRPRDLSTIRRTTMPAMVAPDLRPMGVPGGGLGMTEMCGNHIGADPYRPLAERHRGSIGVSLDGLEHRIVDPETGLSLPAGQEGEIWVRGYSLMQRLHKREREETFTHDGFYRTGDVGWMANDGWVTFSGRRGDMIKTGGGVNVTPGEVETALMACVGVVEAYVVGVLDDDGAEVVGAAVVAAGGVALDGDDLRHQLLLTLAAYKVPRKIWISQKDELPFGDTGKIKRQDLAALIPKNLQPNGS